MQNVIRKIEPPGCVACHRFVASALRLPALVAELADAHDSGSCARNGRGGSTPLQGKKLGLRIELFLCAQGFLLAFAFAPTGRFVLVHLRLEFNTGTQRRGILARSLGASCAEVKFDLMASARSILADLYRQCLAGVGILKTARRDHTVKQTALDLSWSDRSEIQTSHG